MAITISAKLTLAFEDATNRTYTFNGVAAQDAPRIKNKVKAINASLSAGTANSFANTFVSDTGKPCVVISKAQIITLDQEVIYSAN